MTLPMKYSIVTTSHGREKSCRHSLTNFAALPAPCKRPGRIHRPQQITCEAAKEPVAVPAAVAVTLPQQAGSAPLTSVVSMINLAVGAGILSMPYAYSLVGLPMGLGLTVGLAAVETLTMCVLCYYAEQFGATSYSSLVEKALGPRFATVLGAGMYIYLLLSCTAYLMIAADCLCPLLAGAFGPQLWASEARSAVVAAVGLGVVLPLSLPRTLGAVTSVSTFKVWAVLFVVGAVVSGSVGTLGDPAFHWTAVQGAVATPQGLCVAMPILAFGYQCHTAAIDVFTELRPAAEAAATSSSPTQQSSNNSSSSRSKEVVLSPKLQTMAGVGAAAFGAMAAFYCVMGVAGYLAFPHGVDSNIMNSYPPYYELMQFARSAVGAIVIAAFPVNHVPARSTALDLLARLAGGTEQNHATMHSDGAYAAETFVFCGAATAVAVAVTDLGALFQLIGGTAAAALMFGVPGALLLQAALRGDAAEQPQQQWGRVGLFAAGASLEVLTLAFWWATFYNSS